MYITITFRSGLVHAHSALCSGVQKPQSRAEREHTEGINLSFRGSCHKEHFSLLGMCMRLHLAKQLRPPTTAAVTADRQCDPGNPTLGRRDTVGLHGYKPQEPFGQSGSLAARWCKPRWILLHEHCHFSDIERCHLPTTQM